MTQDKKQTLLSFVPKDQLQSIRRHGLLSSKALLNKPEVLESVAKERGMDPREWRKSIESGLQSGRSQYLEGPSVLFKGPPDVNNLLENHPLRKKKMVGLRVRLNDLKKKQPETRVHGMELMPYDEYRRLPKNEQTFDKRDRDLSPAEIDEMMAMKSSQLWGRYNDIDKKGLYAPDVPHASIITPSGAIDPEFIDFPTNAQEGSQLPTAYMRFLSEGEEKCGFTVEIASTPETQKTGLMNREELPLERGMLFVFPEMKHRSFWMRNTLIPLDMVFLDADGVVVGIIEDTEPLDENSYHVDAPSQYVLELNAGRVRDCDIQEGWTAGIEVPEQ